MTHAVDAPPAPDDVGRAAQPRPSPAWAPWLLAGILAVAVFFHLWGIRRDLPYITDDATWTVNPALLIAGSGNANPHVFGNPGSTLIYPLAAAYHAWNAVAHRGQWLHPDPSLRQLYLPGFSDARLPEFHLIGRLLTVVYALLAVGLVYRIGCDAFGPQVGLLGALFTALYPTEVFDKRVRPDSASLFFALLALWCCLRVYRRPTLIRQLLAGAVIGLAIGTKYYLGTIVAVLFSVDLVVLWQRRGQPEERVNLWLGMLAGLGAVALGFMLSTPYFFLDFATATKDLQEQMRTSHPGADGLSPPENLLWYLTMLPSVLSWPQTLAAGVGIALVIWQRRVEPLLLLVFAASFLAGISSSALHWERWLIPILPVFALYTAFGLQTVVRYGSARVGAGTRLQAAALAVGIVGFAGASVIRLVASDRLHARPSTHVLARQWITENLPVGGRVAFEWETLPPPLSAIPIDSGVWITRDGGHTRREISVSKLAVKGSLEWYAQRSYRYLVTSSLYYEYYPANAERYPKEAAFYRQLLAEGHLVREFRPSAQHQGAEMRIYEIE